jgi:6-phosphogluconolactonase (cycloisomerase 2 family)
MKFGKVGQVGLVSAIALVVATLFTACGTLTVGFMFVTTNQTSPGKVEVYEVNSESGVMRQIPTSPFPSGGRNPIAEAVSPNSLNLYVVNQDDNNITQFGIGNDGKVYPQSTVNTPGSFPSAIAINAAGTFLFVLDTLQPVAGCSLENACPGDIAVFPINSDGSLGAPVANNNQYPTFWPLQLPAPDAATVLTPIAVTLTPNGKFAYVTAWNANSTPSVGYLFAYSVSSAGALTPVPGASPLVSGSEPYALTADPSNNYLYVADFLSNKVSTYALSSTGLPAPVSTVATGNSPSALILDGSSYLFVTNSADATLTTYTVSSGKLSPLATNDVGVDPIAVVTDPRHIGYLYTVNFLGSNITGFQINPSSGALINAQNSPYVSSAQPTAITGIPHGGSTH